MSTEVDANAQVGVSEPTDDAAKADTAADIPKDEEAAVPAVTKSANHKSSLKESIMSHNLERDRVSSV